MDLISTMEIIFKSQACFNASFLANSVGNFSCTSKSSGIDVADAEKAFSSVANFENDTLKQIVSIFQRIRIRVTGNSTFFFCSPFPLTRYGMV